MSAGKRSILLSIVALPICLLTSAPAGVCAQSVWQKMKQTVLQQPCQQGLQKACKALAQMNQKQPQQQAPIPAQQPAQPGQHPSSDTGQYASGIFIDAKYTPVVVNSGMKMLEFTADSKHIVWAQGVSGRDALRIFVDGKAVAEADTAISPSSHEGWWDMAPDGSLSVLAQDQNNLKRITITPSAETSFATLGGG